MDELARVRWLCTILDHVRRTETWGMVDVDVLRRLVGTPDPASLAEMEPDLRHLYGEPLDVPRAVISGL